MNDDIVYYGQGVVFGLFKVLKPVDKEFNGWDKNYPFQIKIEPVIVVKEGVSAKSLQKKIQMQKTIGASLNLVRLSDTEFSQIKRDIEMGKKELSFF